MPEPLHQSSDVPEFDTYPSTPPVNEGERLLPKGKSALEQRAADLGTAAGKVVSIFRQARTGVKNLPDRPMVERISDLAGDARERVDHIRTAAMENVQHAASVTRDKTIELGRQVKEKTADLGRQAKLGYYRARLRANQTVREYPVQVALAAGLVGFLIGIGLRIRRANRAY
ncbi:MAG TPA: hypothetical protein VKQ89_08110 [Candidatus Angelobacter sp.]|nr:hypothetical protein [Candidatus Angelobacter sp.]